MISSTSELGVAIFPYETSSLAMNESQPNPRWFQALLAATAILLAGCNDTNTMGASYATAAAARADGAVSNSANAASNLSQSVLSGQDFWSSRCCAISLRVS
jgi:hypothetical protein